MTTRLVVATRNRHKTDEIRAMLGEGFMVEDLVDHPEIPEIEETGTTFLENATLKAVGASRHLPAEVLVLSDDSGLEVDALGGAPGVYSARYAGPGATDADNRRKLLAALDEARARGRERTGRFRCCMVLARGGVPIADFDGSVDGVIGPVERGNGGFGYDALFIPDGHCETFAQLPAEAKNGMSHRARALARVIKWLDSRCPPPDAA